MLPDLSKPRPLALQPPAQVNMQVPTASTIHAHGRFSLNTDARAKPGLKMTWVWHGSYVATQRYQDTDGAMLKQIALGLKRRHRPSKHTSSRTPASASRCPAHPPFFF